MEGHTLEEEITRLLFACHGTHSCTHTGALPHRPNWDWTSVLSKNSHAYPVVLMSHYRSILCASVERGFVCFREMESILLSSLLLCVWPVSPQACLSNGPVLIALIQVRNIAFNDV